MAKVEWRRRHPSVQAKTQVTEVLASSFINLPAGITLTSCWELFSLSGRLRGRSSSVLFFFFFLTFKRDGDFLRISGRSGCKGGLWSHLVSSRAYSAWCYIIRKHPISLFRAEHLRCSGCPVSVCILEEVSRKTFYLISRWGDKRWGHPTLSSDLLSLGSIWTALLLEYYTTWCEDTVRLQ